MQLLFKQNLIVNTLKYFQLIDISQGSLYMKSFMNYLSHATPS